MIRNYLRARFRNFCDWWIIYKLVLQFRLSPSTRWKPLYDKLLQTNMEFIGTRGFRKGPGILVDDDIYWYEVHVLMGPMLDCYSSAYGLQPEEGRQLSDAIISCIPGCVYNTQKRKIRTQDPDARVKMVYEDESRFRGDLVRED